MTARVQRNPLGRAPRVALVLGALTLGIVAGAAGDESGRPPAPAVDRGAGDPCTVPGSHPTVQQAVDDPGCSEVVLASQPFEEIVTVARSVSLQGAPSTIEGQLILRGVGTRVSVSDLAIDSGAVIFADGFESGGSGRWSGGTS